jgi:Predicted branched-chain amino acid permease (azaleucine resistance)
LVRVAVTFLPLFAMNDVLRGMKLALPVIMGYLPVGFAFGVLAVQAGMNPLTVGLMSYFVYAGSAQLITASLLSMGTSTAGIILTTFVVNLRHLLMSAAMTPYLRSWTRPQQMWFSFEMTDETFAANLGRYASHGANKGESFGLNGLAHMGWVMGGVCGALFDFDIAQVKLFGLDFALPGMFIALLLPHFHIPRRVIALISGACLSTFLALLGAGQWNVMAATICAASLAAFLPVKNAQEAARG